MEGMDGRFGKLGKFGIVNDGMDGMDGMDMRGMCCEMDGRATDGRYSLMLDVESRRNCVFSVGSDGKPHDEEQSASTSPFSPIASYGLNSGFRIMPSHRRPGCCCWIPDTLILGPVCGRNSGCRSPSSCCCCDVRCISEWMLVAAGGTSDFRVASGSRCPSVPSSALRSFIFDSRATRRLDTMLISSFANSGRPHENCDRVQT